VAPRQFVGDFDKGTAFPLASRDAIARVASRLGFSLPPLLQRLYLEVADGGFGPGYGLFPAEEHASGEGHSETIVEAYEKLSADPRGVGSARAALRLGLHQLVLSRLPL
jgi:hypothetical protein